MFRVWLFIAGVTALLAIMAGAYGAHALNSSALFPTAAKIYDTAQLFHMVHGVALFGIAILMASTDGRRAGWARLDAEYRGVCISRWHASCFPAASIIRC